MKLTEAFHVSEPPPWSGAEASLELAVAPVVPGRHPCGNCLAMCCWFVLVERGQLETVADLEAVEAHLAYDRLVVWIERDGAYTLGAITPCRLLARDTCACTVHGTEVQPRLCRDYDAHACFYRPRSETGLVEEALRLSGLHWADYRRRVMVDEGGEVRSLPEVTLHELERQRRRFDRPVTLELPLTEDMLPQRERLADLLPFLANFERLEVARRRAGWVLRVRTCRAEDAAPTELEAPVGSGDVGEDEPVRVTAAEAQRLHREFGPSLWDLSLAALRWALGEHSGEEGP